jgi:hypothetical protein
MMQVTRNAMMAEWGFLDSGQYLIHDRDTKFCLAFQAIIEAAEVKRESSCWPGRLRSHWDAREAKPHRSPLLGAKPVHRQFILSC